MLMLLHVRIPNETFNAAVKDGTAGKKLKRILDELKPEAAYFTEDNGHRGALLVVNVADASKVPMFAEPWFLLFSATCEFRIAMTPDDLAKAGLDSIAKKWS
ncbi:MAG: hypothetical protein WA755_13390 [Candidatus Acidiferrales bacterium]